MTNLRKKVYFENVLGIQRRNVQSNKKEPSQVHGSRESLDHTPILYKIEGLEKND